MRGYRLYENIDPHSEISAENMYQASHFDYAMPISQVFEEVKLHVMEKGIGLCQEMIFAHEHDLNLNVKKHFEIMTILKILISCSVESDASWIKVSSEIKDDLLILKVEDNGNKMSEKELKKVFNPHYKFKKESLDRNSSEYGLFNVRKAVISTKGKFHIDNEVEHGTVYTVKIPVASVIADK